MGNHAIKAATARFICALSLIALPITALADPSVVDAYREIQDSGLAPDLGYRVQSKPGGWAVQSPDWGTDIPITVDGPHGFIEIMDEGTGGGSFETQVVLWRQADGTPLVGIGETIFDPPYPETTRLRFFGFDTKLWGNWSTFVWPDVGLEDFLTGTMSIDDLRALRAIRSSVYIRLPQVGLNPVAHLIVRNEEVEAVCRGEAWFVPTDLTPYLRYCQQMQGELYSRLELIWDPVNAVFSKGTPTR